METKEQLEKELIKITRWEKEQSDLFFWEKLGRLPFEFIDKITPKFIHKKIGLVIDELASYVENGGKYLVNQKEIITKYKKKYSTVNDIDDIQSLSIDQMDKFVDELIQSRSKMASVQGATTGFGGIFTLVIDIPAVLALSLKILQEISIAYGYNPNDKEDRIFIIKCLQFSSSDINGKQSILKELSEYHSPQNKDNTVSQIEGWREVILAYKDNFGLKKLFQVIPIVGMLFGAYFNKKSIEDVAEVGKMLYKKRRVLDKLTYLN